MPRPHNMLDRFLILCDLFSKKFLQQSIAEGMKVHDYLKSKKEKRTMLSDDSAFQSTALIHLFQAYLDENCYCNPRDSNCSTCKDWYTAFSTVREKGIMPATHSMKYNSIDDFVRNFSPPIEGTDDRSIARLREPIKQMIPTTHLLNRPFMIERGLDIHPSSSVAWLGGNCNELTSIYNNLDDFEELNDGKVFAQFAHQLHCIPFVQSRQDNVLIITPMWSAIEGLADVYIKSKTLEKSLNALQDHTWPESMKSAFKVSMDLVADRDKIADPRWMFITLAIPWHDAKEQWGDTAIPAHFCRWFSLDGKEITFKLKNEHQYERREEP